MSDENRPRAARTDWSVEERGTSSLARPEPNRRSRWRRDVALGVVASLIAAVVWAVASWGIGRATDTTRPRPTTSRQPPPVSVHATTSTTRADSTTTSRTTVLLCTSSFDSRCPPFRWSSAPNNKPLTVAVGYSPANPAVGQEVTFRIAVDDPDDSTNLRLTETFFGDATNFVGAGLTCAPIPTGTWPLPAPTPPGHSELELAHTYTAAGTYSVHFSAASGGETQHCLPDPYASQGDSNTLMLIVMAAPRPPVTTTTTQPTSRSSLSTIVEP
jgi:hypothetical protein